MPALSPASSKASLRSSLLGFFSLAPPPRSLGDEPPALLEEATSAAAEAATGAAADTATSAAAGVIAGAAAGAAAIVLAAAVVAAVPVVGAVSEIERSWDREVVSHGEIESSCAGGRGGPEACGTRKETVKRMTPCVLRGIDISCTGCEVHGRSASGTAAWPTKSSSFFRPFSQS